MQINVIPLHQPQDTASIKKQFQQIQNYIINNVSPSLSPIQYKKDKYLNIEKMWSDADYKYSILVHSVARIDGKYLHMMYLFKKKK